AYDMGCCYPVGAPRKGQSPPDQSPASRSVVHATCPPVMGGRSWRERGRRPRDRAPKSGEWWSTGYASSCSEGKPTVCSDRKAAGLDAPRRVCRTPPGSESGACFPRGDSGPGESRLVSLGNLRRRSADRRGEDARRDEEASASHTSLARPRDT